MTKLETKGKHTYRGHKSELADMVCPHRMWRAEDRAVWLPVKSKPPQALSPPAGIIFLLKHIRLQNKLQIGYTVM